MGAIDEAGSARGRWLALTAALLGWMFDGLEMGLFPLVARPALKELLPPGADGAVSDADVGLWFAGATAAFLVGAATGGVLFGWLGDRLGRVRAMTLSVLTYALFSGMCGLAAAPWQIVVLRFIAALGMGGEWSLGVALVMELWPNRSRGLLAGLIGAAANVGYMLIALVALGLRYVVADSSSTWRLLLLLGATPAALTFLIRLFVPESERWKHEERRGATSNWMTQDLLGVLVGCGGAILIICLWLVDVPAAIRSATGTTPPVEGGGFGAVEGTALALRVVGTLLGLAVVTVGYLYPIVRFLKRSAAAPLMIPPHYPDIEKPEENNVAPQSTAPMIRTLLLAACLSGVPLLATWGSIQWAPTWADQLTQDAVKQGAAPVPEAKAYTQFWAAFGAVLACVGGAQLGNWLGRRVAYMLLCVLALVSTLFFFQGNTHYGPLFLLSAFLAGGLSASFYGWLPLYLPELFPTRLRAIGQGFGYNFGRILAAVGVLQSKNIMDLLGGAHDYAKPCSILACIYVVGMVLIWFAPETRGQPLPE